MVLLFVDGFDVTSGISDLLDFVDTAISSLVSVEDMSALGLVDPAVNLVSKTVNVDPSVNLVDTSLSVDLFEGFVSLSIGLSPDSGGVFGGNADWFRNGGDSGDGFNRLSADGDDWFDGFGARCGSAGSGLTAVFGGSFVTEGG